MFRLTAQEVGELNRSQIATGSQKHRDPRFPPYAFTEHGAVMLASVLNSTVAVEASIQVVRAFIRIRTILAAHKELARKLEELESKYDARFKVVFDDSPAYEAGSARTSPEAHWICGGRGKIANPAPARLTGRLGLDAAGEPLPRRRDDGHVLQHFPHRLVPVQPADEA